MTFCPDGEMPIPLPDPVIPSPPLSDTIAMWKIKIVLSDQPSPTNAGKTLLDDANVAVAAADFKTQIAWADAADVSQTSPTLASIAAVLGMSSTEIATLYAAACEVAI
jgi:hypothetical protein